MPLQSQNKSKRNINVNNSSNKNYDNQHSNIQNGMLHEKKLNSNNVTKNNKPKKKSNILQNILNALCKKAKEVEVYDEQLVVQEQQLQHEQKDKDKQRLSISSIYCDNTSITGNFSLDETNSTRTVSQHKIYNKLKLKTADEMNIIENNIDENYSHSDSDNNNDNKVVDEKNVNSTTHVLDKVDETKNKLFHNNNFNFNDNESEDSDNNDGNSDDDSVDSFAIDYIPWSKPIPTTGSTNDNSKNIQSVNKQEISNEEQNNPFSQFYKHNVNSYSKNEEDLNSKIPIIDNTTSLTMKSQHSSFADLVTEELNQCSYGLTAPPSYEDHNIVIGVNNNIMSDNMKYDNTNIRKYERREQVISNHVKPSSSLCSNKYDSNNSYLYCSLQIDQPKKRNNNNNFPSSFDMNQPSTNYSNLTEKRNENNIDLNTESHHSPNILTEESHQKQFVLKQQQQHQQQKLSRQGKGQLKKSQSTSSLLSLYEIKCNNWMNDDDISTIANDTYVSKMTFTKNYQDDISIQYSNSNINNYNYYNKNMTLSRFNNENNYNQLLLKNQCYQPITSNNNTSYNNYHTNHNQYCGNEKCYSSKHNDFYDQKYHYSYQQQQSVKMNYNRENALNIKPPTKPKSNQHHYQIPHVDPMILKQQNYQIPVHNMLNDSLPGNYNNTNDNANDDNNELCPGVFGKLHAGINETNIAFENGNIIFPTCIVCNIDLICIATVEYVLCLQCKVISPIKNEQTTLFINSSHNNNEQITKNSGIGIGVPASNYQS